MKESADEVLDLLGIQNNPTLQVAKELERIALEDDYFVSKKLYPNVDFYSGIILDAMGFPVSMFTPIFALSRTVGWISPVEGDDRAIRPRRSGGRVSFTSGRSSATTCRWTTLKVPDVGRCRTVRRLARALQTRTS